MIFDVIPPGSIQYSKLTTVEDALEASKEDELPKDTNGQFLRKRTRSNGSSEEQNV